ncbi:MAG: tyrosine-type recombinase/integrase [Mesorhizobium sp.]|nr:tyrosine-type recombinase/integrase [Mesorhizobium sp.]
MGEDRKSVQEGLDATAQDLGLTDEDIHAAARHWLSTPMWRGVLERRVDKLLPGELRAYHADLPEKLLAIDSEEPEHRLSPASARQMEALYALEASGYGAYDERTLDRTADALLSLLRRRVEERVQQVFRPVEGAEPIPTALPAEAVSAPSPADANAVGPDTLLSVAGKTILDVRRDAKGGDEGKPDRYQERLESALDAFLDVVGDKPLRQYLPIDMQTFANALAKVPKNRSKYAFLKGLSLREMAETNAKRRTPLKGLATTTIRSNVAEVGNLWTRITAGVDGVKDLKSFRMMMPSAATASIVREGLSNDALNLWLADAARQHPRKPHRKWLPLVGLVTGMRISEIVWLQHSDFVEKDGHTAIDLRLPIVVNGRRRDRPLKNPTSHRVVALHPILEQTGFLDFARGRTSGFLFPGCHGAKDPGDATGKQMATWMKNLGIWQYQVATFHSLRHNAKHWLRSEVGDTVADRQCGHAPASVGARYGFKVLQTADIRKIEAAELPLDVDFLPYLTNDG